MATKIDGTIIDGVRYKRGSVKIIEKDDIYHVVVKKYIFYKIQYYSKHFQFETLDAAENQLARIAANLYKAS